MALDKYRTTSTPSTEVKGLAKYSSSTKPAGLAKYSTSTTSPETPAKLPQMEFAGGKPRFTLPSYVSEKLMGGTLEPSKKAEQAISGEYPFSMATWGLPFISLGVGSLLGTPVLGEIASTSTFAILRGLEMAKSKSEANKYISLLESTGKLTVDAANDARDKLNSGFLKSAAWSAAPLALPLGMGSISRGLGAAGKAIPAAKTAQKIFNIVAPTTAGALGVYSVATDPNLSLTEKVGIGAMALGGMKLYSAGVAKSVIKPMVKNVPMIYDQAVKGGGITISSSGVMPKSGYGVETKPGLTLTIPETDLTPKVIENFIAKNATDLTKPTAHLGMWSNKGKWYLGVSEIHPFEDAVRLAINNKQEAIWDFSTNKNIWIKDRYAEPNTYKHYGNNPKIDMLEPDFHGTGKPGEESNLKREYPELWGNRTYLYALNKTPESGLGQYEYRLTKPGKVLSPDDAAWRIMVDIAKKERGVRGYGENDPKALDLLFYQIAKDKGYNIVDMGDGTAISLTKQEVVPVAQIGSLPKVNIDAPEVRDLTLKAASIFERDIKPALIKMADLLLKRKENVTPNILGKLSDSLMKRMEQAFKEVLPKVPEKGTVGEDWSQRAQNMVAAINSATSVAKVKGGAENILPRIIESIGSDFGRKTVELGAIYGKSENVLKGLREVDEVFAKPTQGGSIGDKLSEVHTGIVTQWISKFYPLTVLENKLMVEHGVSKSNALKLGEQFELLEGVKGKAAGQIEDFEIALNNGGIDKADLNRYNFLNRIKNYLENGYDFSGWKEEDVINSLSELQQKVGTDKWNKLLETSKLYQKFTDDNLKIQIDSGRLSEKEYNIIKESNDFYAKFQVMDDISKPEFTRKSLATVKPLTQERTGVIEKVRLEDTILEAEIQRESSLLLAEQNRRMQSLGGLAKVDTEGLHVRMLQTAEELQTRIESLTKMRDLFAAQTETNKVLGKTEQERSVIAKGIQNLLGKKTSYRIYTLEDKIATTNAQIAKLLDEARFSAESWTPPENMNKMLKQVETKEQMISRNTKNLMDAMAEFQMNQTTKLMPKLQSLNKIHAILTDLELMIDSRQETINMLRGIVKNTAEIEVPKGMKRVQYFRNGYRETIAVEPEIAAVLSGLTSNQTGFLTQFLRPLSVPMKVGATGMSAGFQAMNFGLFDPMRMGLLSKYGVKNPLDVISFPFMQMFSLYHSLRGNLGKPTALYREFTEILAANSTMQRAITPELFKGKEQVHGIIKGMTAFAKLSSALEEATKIHTIMRAKRFENLEQLRLKVKEAEANKLPESKDLKKQLREVEDKIASETRNFGGSPDFPKGGATSEEMNIIAMFMKARLLGINSDFARLRGTAGGRQETLKAWSRIAALYLLPTTILALKNQSPEGRKAYDTLSENDTQNNIFIPKGNVRTLEDGTQIPDFWKLPKRDVFQSMDNMINGMVRYAYDRDPEYLKKMAAQLSSDMSPINLQGDTIQERAESFIGGLHPVAKLGYEVASGRNPTFHTNIIPASNLLRLQREEKAPKLIQWVGGKLEVSPLLIQEYANTLTGGGASLVAPKQKEIPVLGAIKKRLERSESYQAPLAKELSEAVKSQDMESLDRSRKAYKHAQEIKDLPPMEIRKKLVEIAGTDRLLARTTRDMVVALNKGLAFHEKQLLSLDVSNGARAKFLMQELEGKSPEQSKEYLKTLAQKRILTRNVYMQMQKLGYKK